jgi:signal recognition particle receptor subunit beta/predicted  nucleic acid-binding Zn-ribbon protein
MVFFNASTRELTAKIVYYGPGLGGKTTNLKVLHERLEPRTAGDLVALSTENDRTIYFDLLPVELGDIKGYRIRFQLTTVPGQTAYNETRRVVLKGADGIVFVADSQWTLLPKNLESWQSLRENLAANGLSLDTMPVVVQYNKRDLPDILSVEAMEEALGFSAYPHVEAVASDGRGVTETFKLISKLTFLDLLRRLQSRPTPDAVAIAGEAVAVPPAPAADDARPPLTLVRTPPEESSDEGAPAAEEAPFPEAAVPFDAPAGVAAAETDERFRALEERFTALESAVAAVEELRVRLEGTERKIDETREGIGAALASYERRTEERIRALEERLDAEASRGRGAHESLFEEFGRLRERAERLDEQTSAFARDLEEMQRTLSEKAEPRPEAEDLKLQLAPLLEEQVRRETDENWTAEIERLRQALAESLEDLSERVRKAVRG